MAGYASDFLGPELPLPGTAAGRPIRVLDYEHFTVQLDPERRLAAATSVNIDGESLRDLERGDDWHLDDRVPADEQAGPALYARNDLDRGHLVRRRDPVWGAAAAAQRANADTFVYTNAAPQAAGFNQSKQLWVGLEDYVLEHARANRQRLSVFTGPVFAPDDPLYRGVRIPRLFWKVAAWAAAEGLASSGYVLDQTPALDDIDLDTARAIAAGDPPPLGPFRTFQVPVSDVARLTGLDLDDLIAADVLVARSARAAPVPWRPLTVPEDMLL